MRSRSTALAVAEPRDALDDSIRDAARLLAEGEIDAAVVLIDRARAREPRNVHVRFLLGITAWRLHDLVSATNILTGLLEEEGENGTFTDTLATLRAVVGDLNEALFLGKLAAALQPDPLAQSLLPPDFPTFAAAFTNIQERPLVRLSRVLAHQGWLQPSTRALEQHVRLFPDDLPAATELAGTLLATGREAEVIQHVGPLVHAADARSVSILGRAAAASADYVSAARLHEAAAEASADDADITAARLRDTVTPDAEALDAWLRRFALPPSPRPLPPRAEKRRVGYLVAGVAGSPLAGFVSALARRHDRERTEVFGYGYGELQADCNADLRGGFDTWRDVSRIDARTIGRILEADGLDIVIDASGLRHPASLRALFATGVPRRCGWLGLPVTTAAAPYDCVLASAGEIVSGPRPCVPVGPSAFAVQATVLARRPDDVLRLGLDLLPREVIPALVEQLTDLLRLDPSLRLVFRDHGLSLPIVVDRLIAQFGSAAGRIDLVKAAEPREFLEQIDLLFSPAFTETPRAAVEAMAHGVPVLIAAGSPAADRAAAVARSLRLAGSVLEPGEDAAPRLAGMLADIDSAWVEAGRVASGDAFAGRRLADAIDALVPQREGRDAR